VKWLPVIHNGSNLTLNLIIFFLQLVSRHILESSVYFYIINISLWWTKKFKWILSWKSKL